MANANGWGDGASNNTIGWGKGADNAIGWGDIHADSYAGLTDIVGAAAFDADAQAFITAAAITDPTQQTAINTLVVDLKGYSIWTKMKALYPFVGGTAVTHKWNLKNPLDTDAAFRVLWSGGVTHSSNGVLFGGVNGYANTNLAPNSALTANSNHIALYSRTTAARANGVALDFGQGTDLNISNGIWGCSRRSSNNALYGATNASALGLLTVANTDGSGMFVNSITSATSRKIYRNAVTLGTLITNISQTLSAPKMFMGATNNNGSPNLYSDYQTAFFSIGDGLNDTEALNLYTAVQAFNTTLGRQV